MTTAQLLLGQTLTFTADPFHAPVDESTRHERRGAVLVEGNKIIATGTADDLRAAHPQANITDYGAALIMAGFIDAHAHYPQTGIIASWGKRLIDWLNTYTFPEETRFADGQRGCSVRGGRRARPTHHCRQNLYGPKRTRCSAGHRQIRL